MELPKGKIMNKLFTSSLDTPNMLSEITFLTLSSDDMSFRFFSSCLFSSVLEEKVSAVIGY
jgi:hypothetical protein